MCNMQLAGAQDDFNPVNEPDNDFDDEWEVADQSDDSLLDVAILCSPLAPKNR